MAFSRFAQGPSWLHLLCQRLTTSRHLSRGDTQQSIVGRIQSCIEVSQDGFSRLQEAVLCFPKHLPEQTYPQLPGEHLAEGLSSWSVLFTVLLL